MLLKTRRNCEVGRAQPSRTSDSIVAWSSASSGVVGSWSPAKLP
jgi:hypothetical protein